MEQSFKLTLKLHTPIILPRRMVRLDTLLLEAQRRLHQDWETPHELPLARFAGSELYCASQLILGSTASRPLAASTEKLVTTVTRQDLTKAAKVKRRFGSTFPDGEKLTQHQAIAAPYALFYGVGDAQRCAALLTLLSGIGREHARHYGAFTLAGIEDDQEERWRLRPWPIETEEGWMPSPETFVDDVLSVTPGRGEDVAVKRPPRLIREVVYAR